MARFGFSRADLEAVNQKIVDADNAKINHQQKKGDARMATAQREKAFKQLGHADDLLTTVCIQAIGKDSKKLVKLGLKVLTPEYKKRKRNENKELTKKDETEKNER